MDTTQKKREAAERPVRQEAAKKTRPAQTAGAASHPKKAEAARQPQKKVPSANGAVKAPVKKKKPPLKKLPAKKVNTKGERPPKKPDEEDIGAKKRAYGKSKPKKRPADSVANLLKKTAKKTKKSADRPRQPTPAVIYTQPQAFNRNRLLLQLVTVTAIVAALVLGISVFFRVEQIEISGAEVYDSYQIEKASGIEKGDNLLTFSRPRAGALIKANLPYVDTVRFGIKLPGTVNIIIEEDDVVYAIKGLTTSDGEHEQWWLMNSDGRIVEKGTGSKAANHTQILGVTLDDPVPDGMAVATENISTETYPTEDPNFGQPMPVTQTNAQRLTAALQILQALEANDIVGAAASVDVTRLDDIILWYGTRYQVNLGDNANLSYKIACMNDVILQMSDYQSGILDISFTIWPDQVGYTPFA